MGRERCSGARALHFYPSVGERRGVGSERGSGGAAVSEPREGSGRAVGEDADRRARPVSG